MMKFPLLNSPLGRKRSIPARYRYALLGMLFFFCLVHILSFCGVHSTSWRGSHSRFPRKEYYAADATNDTLGFGRVFYISLPHRTDRQDAMQLIASSSNIDLTLQSGIDGNSIHEKATPEFSSGLRPEQLGCWRGHADTWKRILDEDLETALILEDDVDWDVSIHKAFGELGRQMRKGNVHSAWLGKERAENVPYGLDWDLLYVGTCWDIPNIDHRPRYNAYYDPIAPTRAELAGTYLSELEGWGLKVTNQTHWRLLAPSWYPVCTIGYAVTRRGAQKLLYNIGGYKGFGSPLDLAMIDLIQKEVLTAYTVIPPLITPFRTGGIRDSDIDDQSQFLDRVAGLEGGTSENLLQSARAELGKTLGKSAT